jgi:hypothetical protein
MAGLRMIKISREQAEKLFLDSEVIDTRIQQDKNELRVIMKLSDNQTCHVSYNFKSKEKTYLLETQNLSNPGFGPF